MKKYTFKPIGSFDESEMERKVAEEKLEELEIRWENFRKFLHSVVFLIKCLYFCSVAFFFGYFVEKFFGWYFG